jgi:hypothetical protein
LVGYYGLLQLSHLGFLGRALVMYIMSGVLPFPASPPNQGWSQQVVPFFFGMGAVDALAAGLGISFAVLFIFKRKIKIRLGLISLVIALTSALVFMAGTLASGAWEAHPGEYLSMVVAFFPLPYLLICLLREKSEIP